MEYQNTIEAKLNKLDNRIEELKNEAEKSGGKIKADLEKGIKELEWKKENTLERT